jgi:hypothetical protein
MNAEIKNSRRPDEPRVDRKRKELTYRKRKELTYRTIGRRWRVGRMIGGRLWKVAHWENDWRKGPDEPCMNTKMNSQWPDQL